MDILEYIESQSKIYEKWKLKTIGAICSEVLRPLINEFGSVQTVQTFNEIIESLWDFESNHDDTSLKILQSKLESLPESDIDDSLTLSYYVMRSLGVCFDSLEQSELNSCYGLVSLCADIDYVTNERGTDKSLEISSELLLKEVVQKLSSINTSVDIRNQFHIEISSFVEQVETALPVFEKGYDWS